MPNAHVVVPGHADAMGGLTSVVGDVTMRHPVEAMETSVRGRDAATGRWSERHADLWWSLLRVTGRA